VLIELDLSKCLNTEQDTQLPPVVILGGEAFGQYDASFISYVPNTQFSFHAPRALVSSQQQLIVKPLFGEALYTQTFALPQIPVVDAISVARATKQTTTFLVAGAHLNDLSLPPAVSRLPGAEFSRSPAYAELTLPTPALVTLKQVTFIGATDAVPRLVVTLPDGGSPKEPAAASGASLFGVSLLNAEDPLTPVNTVPATLAVAAPPASRAPPPSTSQSQHQSSPPPEQVIYTITANDPKLDVSLDSAQVLTFSGLTQRLKENPAVCDDAVSAAKKGQGGKDGLADLGGATVLYANHDLLVFALPQALQEIVLLVPATVCAGQGRGANMAATGAPPPASAPEGSMPPGIYLLDLPKLPTVQTATKAFKPDKVTIKQNGTGALKVTGDSIDQIASASYLGTQLPVLISADGMSVTIGTVPAMTQQVGNVPIAVRLKDGSRNEVLVDVSAQ
jgi:hypothetical protein